MSSDRKTLIADTAISLLASAGARGLTHRAVDAQAGLPPGSTSFYCRTRMDLLALVLVRHASLDWAELEEDARSWLSAGPSLTRFVAALADRIDDWLSAAKRERLVARAELFLIASREPELAVLVKAQRQRFLVAAAQALRAVGVAQPGEMAPVLAATVDGILFSHIADEGQRLSRETCHAMLWRALSLPARSLEAIRPQAPC